VGVVRMSNFVISSDAFRYSKKRKRKLGELNTVNPVLAKNMERGATEFFASYVTLRHLEQQNCKKTLELDRKKPTARPVHCRNWREHKRGAISRVHLAARSRVVRKHL